MRVAATGSAGKAGPMAAPEPNSLRMTTRLDRIFKLSERGTNVRTEITAGLTTFAAMAYILAVNPQILSATGMDFGAVVTAGRLGEPRVLLVLGGIVLAAVLHFRRVKGAIILSVLALTVIGLVIPTADDGFLTKLPPRLFAVPASLAPTFFAFDFAYLAA